MTQKKQFNQERLMQVLLGPQLSEKATNLGERYKQIVFYVLPGATKQEIGAAVELLFKTQVQNVQVANVKGKRKRFGATRGWRSDKRKAFVTLRPGQEDIHFAAGEGGIHGAE